MAYVIYFGYIVETLLKQITMIKKLLLLILSVSAINFYSQDSDQSDINGASVDKSVFEIVLGTDMVLFTNAAIALETKLANRGALRTELGVWAGTWRSDDGTQDFIFVPKIQVEPRWYYNIEKRKSNGKEISKNSANFLTPSISIATHDFKTMVLCYSLKWGMRRVVSEHFNYGFGIGFGLINFRYEVGNSSDNILIPFPDLQMRIGYTF